MTYLVGELLAELTIVNKNDLQDAPIVIIHIDGLTHTHAHTHTHTHTYKLRTLTNYAHLQTTHTRP